MEGEREGKTKEWARHFGGEFTVKKEKTEILLLVQGDAFCVTRTCLVTFPSSFFLTGELGRGDCRPMAGQEGNSYCMLNAGQRRPPLGQDLYGSQRMVRRLAGLIFLVSLCWSVSQCQ